MEFSYTIDRSIDPTITLESHLTISTKLNICIPHDSAIPLLAYTQKQFIRMNYRRHRLTKACNALFIVAKNQKCLIIDNSLSSTFIYICVLYTFLGIFHAFLYLFKKYSIARYARPFLLGPAHFHSLVSPCIAPAPDILIHILDAWPLTLHAFAHSVSMPEYSSTCLTLYSSAAWISPTYTSKPKSDITSFQSLL